MGAMGDFRHVFKRECKGNYNPHQGTNTKNHYFFKVSFQNYFDNFFLLLFFFLLLIFYSKIILGQKN